MPVTCQPVLPIPLRNQPERNKSQEHEQSQRSSKVFAVTQMFPWQDAYRSIVSLFFSLFGVTTRGAQGLLLVLRSGITPGRLGGPYGMLGLNPGWPCARKMSTYCVLSPAHFPSHNPLKGWFFSLNPFSKTLNTLSKKMRQGKSPPPPAKIIKKKKALVLVSELR